MKKEPKCKICRRCGSKLSLKGERCLTQKCAMIRKPYHPGEKSKKGRGRNMSDYGKELIEKQKLKNWYNLSERQFENYTNAILEQKSTSENPVLLLIQKLESRFDNVIFRLGWAPSRPKARQLISHRHFTINGRRVNIASYMLKINDEISVCAISRKKKVFETLSRDLKSYEAPSWIKLDKDKLEGKIIAKPSLEEATPPAEVSTVFEYYSR
ncbi:MAG: 30S ribosomal protein S4 [bacterium]